MVKITLNSKIVFLVIIAIAIALTSFVIGSKFKSIYTDIPEGATQILLEKNITCFGKTCYNLNDRISCYIEIGEWFNDTCFIGRGTMGEIDCFKTKDGLECLENPRAKLEKPKETEKIDVLFYDQKSNKCCVIKTLTGVPSYECWSSSLKDCIQQLLN